jgi:E3 ubiquitin-protein ligase UBR7
MSETDTITTLSAHLDHIESLNAEAKELMPFKVDECSFSQGYVRQKVWACRTCAGDAGEVGVCYACSVSCHAGTSRSPWTDRRR